jgi:hypothetical protein
VNSQGGGQNIESAEKKVIVARLSRWRAPLDLSMAPIFMVLALIPNTIVDLQAGDNGRNYLFKLFLVKLTALLIWLTILKLVQMAIEKRSPAEINLFLLGILGAVIGAISGTYVHYVSARFGLPADNTTFLRRVSSTAVVGFSWLPVTVVLSSSFKRIKSATSAYENQTKFRQNFRNSSFYKSYRNRLNANIERRLDSLSSAIRDEIQKLSPTPDVALQNIETIIKVLETQDLRKLSNELVNRISLPLKSSLISKMSRVFKFVNLVLEAVFVSFKTTPLNPRIFTYIVTICTFGVAIRRNQSLITTLQFGLFVGLFTLGCSSATFMAWKLRSRYFVYFATFFALLNIYGPAKITHALINHHVAFAALASGHNFSLLWAVLIIVCILLGHLGNASINQSRNIFNFSKLNKELSEIEHEMILDQENLINHKWAIHIHGKIQTRLSTSVLSIRQSLAAKDMNGVLKAIDAIQIALAEPTSGFIPPDRDLQSEIFARLAPWKGLLEGDVIIDPKLIESKKVPVQVIGEVVEEILSNSSRHGAATQIRIEIRKISRDRVLLRTEDNSINLPPAMGGLKKGVGTSIFNSASDGRWTLRRDARRAKTVLEMRIDGAISLN